MNRDQVLENLVMMGRPIGLSYSYENGKHIVNGNVFSSTEIAIREVKTWIQTKCRPNRQK